MISEMYKSLLEQIFKAKEEAIKRRLKTNRIVIDEGLAYHEGFIDGFKVKVGDVYDKNYIIHSQPMILGMAVEFQKGLREELGLNFIIDGNPSKIEALEAEIKELKDALSCLEEHFSIRLSKNANTNYYEEYFLHTEDSADEISQEEFKLLSKYFCEED